MRTSSSFPVARPLFEEFAYSMRSFIQECQKLPFPFFPLPLLSRFGVEVQFVVRAHRVDQLPVLLGHVVQTLDVQVRERLPHQRSIGASCA